MHIVILVLVEVLIVIGLSRLVGLAFRSIKQPLVIGEIVAGIMLGPSLFGLVAPHLAVTLFPPETFPFLNVLSQVGLIFFMFLIGLELNPKYLGGQLEVAVLTSHVSILVPFSLGTLLAVVLYPLVSNASVSFTAFALFLGAAMSITAFPVLARIITENNLQGTRLGTLALTCAAVDDVTAWCLLAVAIAVARTGDFAGAIPTIIASIVYIGLMLTAGRWFLQRLAKHYLRAGTTQPIAACWDLYGRGCVSTDHRTNWYSLDFWGIFTGSSHAQKRRFSPGIGSKNRRFCFNLLAANIFCLQWFKNTDWPAQPSRIVAFVCVGFRSGDRR
jgi:Kef-type K+ transport system membrane component KefB